MGKTEREDNSEGRGDTCLRLVGVLLLYKAVNTNTREHKKSEWKSSGQELSLELPKCSG